MQIPNIRLPWLRFLVRYRMTALGPIWLLIGPSLFIAVLGFLYAEIGTADPYVFIPHLAAGLVLWTLIAGLVTGSTTVYQRNRADIMQGGQTLGDVVTNDVITTLLGFLHQVPIVVVVFLIYRVHLGWTALLSIPGIVLIVANGVWATQVFGVFGARFRDLSEIFSALMRIAFLATPILWMPGPDTKGTVMGAFLTYNPFYHFMEIVRAPLLGNPISPLTWGVVVSTTVIGFLLAYLVNRRFSRYVPLWI